MAIQCDECEEEVDHVSDCEGFDLCDDCAADFHDFEEYVTQVNDDYRASVL